jgi:hypothetical protein
MAPLGSVAFNLCSLFVLLSISTETGHGAISAPTLTPEPVTVLIEKGQPNCVLAAKLGPDWRRN